MAEETAEFVLGKQPPNEVMQETKEVRPKARPDVRIRVACAKYEEGDPLPWFVRPDGTEAT